MKSSYPSYPKFNKPNNSKRLMWVTSLKIILPYLTLSYPKHRVRWVRCKNTSYPHQSLTPIGLGKKVTYLSLFKQKNIYFLTFIFSILIFLLIISCQNNNENYTTDHVIYDSQDNLIIINPTTNKWITNWNIKNNSPDNNLFAFQLLREKKEIKIYSYKYFIHKIKPLNFISNEFETIYQENLTIIKYQKLLEHLYQKDMFDFQITYN